MRDEPPRHYQGIAAYLARTDGTAVTLTYAQIEALIGEPLPLGALINQGWWTTATMLHVRLWREHGWRAYPDSARRRVRFVRDAEEARDGG